MGGGTDKNEAAARLGVPVELLDDSDTFRGAEDGIYPDCMATVSVFCDMLTQWRVGPTGVTGLDYQALPVVFKIRNVKKRDRQEIFEGLQVMERAALRTVIERQRSR